MNTSALTPVSMDIYPKGVKMVFEINTSSDMTFYLPAAFEIDSVKPVPTRGAQVTYFQKNLVQNSEAVPETLRELYDTIERKQRELLSLQARIKSSQSSMEMIENITEGSITAADPAAYVKALLEMHEDSSVNASLFTMEYEKLKKELTELQQEYQKRLPAGYDKLIQISMGGTGTGKMQIEAFSRAGGWTPSYKMNLISATGIVESTFVAQAQQKTGLSYTGTINFVTQNPPTTNLVLRRINPLIVDMLTTPNTPAARFNASKAYNQISEYAASPDETPYEPAPPITESLTNFSIEGKASLKGDGSIISVDLGKQTYNADLKVVLFRDYGREGHLIATLNNIQEPLLQGNAELSVDYRNSGNTVLTYFGRGETAEILFGFMPLIKVSKSSDTTVTGSGGWLSSGSVQDGYTLEVVNGASIPMNIELVDRIPYSANDKIVVDAVTVNPPADTNKENVLTWKMTLNPGEKRQYEVNYRIKHPSDKEIYFR